MLKATLQPPITLLSTDVVSISGTRATIVRGTETVWAGDLLPLSVPLTSPIFADALRSNVIIWEEPRMPGQQLTPTGVVRNDITGTISFRFSNGSEREVTWGQAENIANGFDQDALFLENLAIAIAFRNSPDAANVTTIVGASLSCNLLADEKIVYTPPAN